MAFRPIFYDTETTGIKSDQDRIVEIAAFDPVRDKTFVALVNPGISIPVEASSVHHITDEMVAEVPNFSVIGQQFIDFCDGEVVLIAHNNDAFDQPFIQKEFARHNLTMPTWKFFDTLKWARRYRPDLPRHSLQFLRETYGIAANNAHRALDDVEVLHKIFCFMTDDLGIEQVCALMNKPRDLQHMPFGKHQGTHLSQVPKEYVIWLKGNGAFDKAENKDLRSAFEKLGVLTPV